MSSPTIIRCYKCHKTFAYLEGSLTKCPYCNEEYETQNTKEK